MPAFLSSADFFFKIKFYFENSFRNTIRVSNSWDPDQAGHFVGPDLGTICLQMLSADGTTVVGILNISILGYLHRARCTGHTAISIRFCTGRSYWP